MNWCNINRTVGVITSARVVIIPYKLVCYILICTTFLFGCKSRPEIELMTLDEAHFGALETRIPEIDFDNVPFVKAMDIFYDMWQHNSQYPVPRIIIISGDYGMQYGTSVGLHATNITALECIVLMCKSSGWRFQFINYNIVFMTPMAHVDESVLSLIEPLLGEYSWTDTSESAQVNGAPGVDGGDAEKTRPLEQK